MNIHEHQAKKILKDFGIAVPNGVVITDLKNIDQKIKKFNTEKLVLKAQIYSGGRGESSVNLKLILDSFFGLFKIYKRKKEIINKTN
jgi:succinyl-CoA synthetase beta subunit